MTRLLKFFARLLLRLLYRVKVEGLEHYREAGKRVLIVANHTSLLDGILLYAWLPETPTFAINTQIAKKGIFKLFLKFVDLFIMDPTSPLSVKSMIKFIRTDKKAVIFPEGRITTTGALMKIYEGPGLVADKAHAAILPIAIDGAQFTPFSYMRGRGRIIWFPKITMKVLPPERIDIHPSVSIHARRKAAALAMQNLMYRLYFSTYDYHKSLFAALLEAMHRHGKQQVILEDINREPLNYKQFITRCYVLANLQKKETKPGEHIGLLLPNVITTGICFMGLQYLGRVVSMLNYSAGEQAVLMACETANIKTVYSSRRFIETAGLQALAGALERNVKLIYLEDLRGRITIFDKLSGLIKSWTPRIQYRKQMKRIGPDDPAVILFTSGSEGIPKGVVLSHKNLLSNFAQVRCHIDFCPSDVLFSCLPLFHSFGLNAGFLMPMYGGSKTFLYPSPLHYRIIPELVYELGVTIFFGTSTFYKGYARYAHQYDFHSLRLTVAGAEKLRHDTQQIWMEKFGIRIYEGYGVTECSPVFSVNTPIACKLGTVGQPLPGMEWYLEPVEGIAEGGDLVMKGPNIMLGYLLYGGDGKIQSPIAERGKGWHATGDIAKVDDDGFISIIGRAKRFAKIGGEMISLTAVEELAMHTWPNYSHAAVNLPDERKGEKIVLVTEYRNATRKQIQEMARELRYSELYIPKRVVLAEELPLLSTGKINYITLTEMALAEDKEGSGWIRKLTNFMKKAEQPEVPKETKTATK